MTPARPVPSLKAAPDLGSGPAATSAEGWSVHGAGPARR